MALKIDLQVIHSGYDRKSCFVHARAGMVRGLGQPFAVVLTMSKMSLERGKNDCYYELYEMRTLDGGRTWSAPVSLADVLGRVPYDGGEAVVCDFWPMWHEASRTLLGTGHSCFYQHDDQPREYPARDTVYSTYDAATGQWARWRRFQPQDQEKFHSEGAGSTQRFDLPDGTILLPSYFLRTGGVIDDPQTTMTAASTVLHCVFDGRELRYIEHGDELYHPTGRGFGEPSLTELNGRFFLTLRNNDDGFVCAGDDGLHFGPVRPWCFDDGSTLGNYNTQQHWVTLNGRLYLVYTRKGANNDHIPRHRAPLFIAEVNPERLCVIRATEQIVVPERGARLGNFGITRISDRESWVTVSEWMQTTWPDPWDCTVCEKYGADNRVYVAKLTAE